MTWSEAADSILLALVRMVPETLRELAAASARDESEAVAEQRGAGEVDGSRPTPGCKGSQARSRPPA